MEAITNFDIEGIHQLKMLLLENKSKLCDMLGKITDPSLPVKEREELKSLCQNHLIAFVGPTEGVAELSWAKEQAAVGDATDCSDMDIA